MVLLAPRLVRVITFNFARAITLYPFIFLSAARDKTDRPLINHERIHLRQQLELWVIPFYLLYLGEYLLYRLRGLSHAAAYRHISFEREAYDHERQLDYLARRPAYGFVRYWRHK